MYTIIVLYTRVRDAAQLWRVRPPPPRERWPENTHRQRKNGRAQRADVEQYTIYIHIYTYITSRRVQCTLLCIGKKTWRRRKDKKKNKIGSRARVKKSEPACARTENAPGHSVRNRVVLTESGIENVYIILFFIFHYYTHALRVLRRA